MKNKPIFLIFLSLLLFGFVSCSFNEQKTDVSFKIPATLCEEIFSPDVTSDDIGDSQEQEQEQEISEIQEGVQEGIQEGVQEGASEQEETDPQESEQQEIDPKESEQETPEKTYFVQVRLFVNDKESKSITKTYNHMDISVTFEKIKIGDSVYAEIAFMVQTKDEETADILATGKTNTAIVEEGTTVLDAELSVKLNSGNEENPPAKTAEYTINYYLQKAEESEPDYVLEKTEHEQGEVGTTTNVTADPDAYKGFNATEITQQEIKEDDSTVVNVYYDRKIYKLEYVDGVDGETVSVPQTKTYRYGATAFIDYALGTREGFTFIGWSDGTNTYKSSLQTTIAIPDADVTLTAVWNEILGPTTYTASNVAQAIAGLQKDSSIVVTGQISNQTISDINAALKTLYAKNTTGQTDKCIKVSLDLSGTTGLTELEDAQGWDDESKKSFYQCYCLKEIVLPDTIETIGENAFYSCSNLESINLPETITSIKKRAFSNTKLESVVIPSKVTVISEGVFSICTALVSCEIKGPVTKVEGAAFYGCSALESIALPDTITTIVGDVLYNLGVFTNCTSLKQANIPNQLTYIPDALFNGCSSLEAVEIPDTVTGIGSFSFYGCETLKQLVLPSSVQTIGAYAFAGCESLQSINIPAGVERIMKSTFSGCAALQSIRIPAAVTLIEDYAFSGCASITTITIPDGIETLPVGAFKDCTNLKTITIPSSVTAFLCDDYAGGGGTFQNCSSLQSITIPAAATYLGRDVFADCSSLTSITIPETVIDISHDAFYGCSNLTQINIPAAVRGIGQGAFYGCTKLQTVTFHESDDDLEIDVLAFANCTSLKSITLPKNMKDGYEAFYGCTALESVVLPATFTNITFEMFCGCTSLKSITIPDTVKTIGQYSFSNCSSLETVYISENSVLEKISEAAFYNCEKLKTIYFPDTLTEVQGEAFTGCTALTQVTIPEKARYDNAFDNTTTVTLRPIQTEPEEKYAKYTVNHYLQNLTGNTIDDYTIDKTQTDEITGLVGSETAAKAKSFTGFEPLSFNQIEISETETNEVKIYYNRKLYKVTYADGLSDEEITVPEEKSYRYGTSVTVDFENIGTREGWNFNGWTADGITYKKGVNETFTLTDENVLLTASWEEVIPETGQTDITIDISIPDSTDIEVTVSGTGINVTNNGIIINGSTGTEITFLAQTGYSEYIWKINGTTATASSNTLTLSTASLNGVNDITLMAKKTVEGKTIYHSYSTQIIKE
ncbi:MAG: leucine-rich repeat protein [Treponema sp.]|nr:leucine-rich repeat protein [Treponema sp.]